jgi:hypothetical protein
MNADPQLFLTRASLLYEVSPAFFHWAGAALLTLLGGLVTLVWFLRGHFAKSEIDGLKGKIGVAEQQLSLAKDQADYARREAEALKAQAVGLQRQVSGGAKQLELTNATADLSLAVGKVLAANEQVSATLLAPRYEDVLALRMRRVMEEIGDDAKLLK